MQNVIKSGRYWPPLAVIVNLAPITTDHPPFSNKECRTHINGVHISGKGSHHQTQCDRNREGLTMSR